MKITFIGHKPQDMGGFQENNLQKKIKENIENILKNSKDCTVITSLSLGVEFWAGEIARKLKIPYEIIIPFENYHSKWPFATRKVYSELLKFSSKKYTISDSSTYNVQYLLEKDLKLIQESDIIYHCFKSEDNAFLKKAKKLNKTVISILPNETEDDYFIKL